MSDKKYEKVSIHATKKTRAHWDYLKSRDYNVSAMIKRFLEESAAAAGYVEKEEEK